MTIVLKRPSLRSKQKCLFRSFGSCQEIWLFCAPRFPSGEIIVVPVFSSLKDKVTKLRFRKVVSDIRDELIFFA